MNQKPLILKGKGGNIQIDEWFPATLNLPVEFDEFGDFAVHASPNLADPYWTLTHVNSGAAVCRADTRTEVEMNGREKLIRVGPGRFKMAIEKVMEYQS